jgi:autotransporter-associated beta strand protein
MVACRWRRLASTALVSALPLLTIAPAQAGTSTWNGTQNGDWSNSGNWSGGAPGSGGDVTLTSSGNAPGNEDQSSGAAGFNSITISSSPAGPINVTTPNGTFNLAAPSAVPNSGSILVNNSVSATFTGNALGLNGAATFTVNSGGSLTFQNNITDGTGPGSITKKGAGTLTLGGANTYTGGTTINGGTLSISSDANLGAVTGGLTLDGGTLQATGNVTLSSTRSVTLGAGGGTFELIASSISITQSIGGPGSLTVTGTGIRATLFLSGNNSYGGSTTIGDHTRLFIDGGNAIPDGSAVIMQGFNELYLSSSETIGSLASTSANSTVSIFTGGNFVLTTGGDNTSTDFAGLIADGAGQIALTKIGAGTMTLTGANGYSGGTNVTGGFINFNSAGNFGSGNITLNGGGLQWATGTSTDISGKLNAIGTNGATFDTNGNDVTFANALSGGGVTKTGAGTLTFTVANAYAGGTTIKGGTLSISDDAHLGAVTGGLTLDGGTLQTTSDVTLSSTRSITLGAGGGTFDVEAGSRLVIAQSIGGPGGLAAVTSAGGFGPHSELSLSGNNTYGGSTTIGDGANVARLSVSGGNAIPDGSAVIMLGPAELVVNSSETIGSLAGTSTGASVLAIGPAIVLTTGGDNSSTAFAGTIEGQLTLTKIGIGTMTLTGANGYSGGTNFNGGAINASADGNLGAATGALTFNGGTLQFGANFDLANTRAITLNALGGTLDTNGFDTNISQSIGGAGGLTKAGAGTLTLSGANSYGGNTVVSGGTILLVGSGTLGNGTGSATVNTNGTLDLGGTTQTLAALNLAGGTFKNGNLNAPITSTGGTINGLGGSASLTTTAGVTFITGTNTYTGGTTVNGGILDVIGSITDPTVNTGGVLMGTGTVGATQVNAGGIFAPGNGTPGASMAISGNLAFQSGAIYLVQVDPTTASFAAVIGTATPGGATVNAVFAPGSYISKQYTILTATGGVSGTFGSLVDTNLPANFSTSLSYDANHAYLNLILNFAIPGGLNGNQQAVGNALTNYFNTTGGIPTVYAMLSAAQLTQASGENATGSQQTTFGAMSQFINLLTDPFTGRGNGINGSSAAPAYADESADAYAASRRTTDAFAMFTKAPPPAPFVQRWSVWAAAYGGSQSTSGNAVVGSNDATSRIAGTAVGADYLFSPNTLAGFALAGGGTSFGVNNLGSGRSDLFQAGAYVRHTKGAAYISGALAYGWQDITTDRTVTIAGIDHLRAQFNANAWSGRVEGGYRFVAPVIGGVGITPYAAAQFTTFDLPAYAEQAIVGSNQFALAYNAKSVTDSRSELGIRTDKSFAMPNGVLTLRGRFAWAHDYDPDRTIAATFQALPGASFVVGGAAQAHDSALTTASAEWKWVNGWAAAATFEGEFSNVTRSYAGKGVVRYAW